MEEIKGQQSDNNKVMKKFKDSLRKVEAITQNPNWARGLNRVPKEEIPSIISKLADKQKEVMVEKFEAALLALFDKKRAHDAVIKKKEKEFQDAVLVEIKKMQIDLDVVIAMVDQIGSIESEYFETLKSIASPSAVASPMASLMDDKEGKDDDQADPEPSQQPS